MKGIVYHQTQKVVSVESAELLKAFDVDAKKFRVTAVRMGLDVNPRGGNGTIELILDEVDSRRD